MTQMINTESNSGGVVNGGVAIPAYKQGFPAQDKQPHGLLKKTALRDVQNQYGIGAPRHQENPGFYYEKDVGASKDSIKMCGVKRLTPELPSSTPLHPAAAKNSANEQIMNANRRFDLELGKGKIQSSISIFASSPQPRQPHQETPDKQTQLKASAPVATPNNILHANSSFGALSGPNLLGKSATRIQATQVDSLRVVASENPSSADCNNTEERSRTERFVCLQNFLKKCDESEYRDYIEMLRRLSPDQLSSHAKGLENRVFKSNFDEAKEMRRTNCLEVLGKASVVSSPSIATLQHLPRK